MMLHLESEVFELQEERRDLLATKREGGVLQLAEDRMQRMQQLDDGDGVDDDDAEVIRTALLKKDESSGA